ncbi:hypothetical protein B296_00057294 [Ensete ventricosum]|uniref:WRKY domain-containing protein n=1 Tax=Ensete ventricosum TaxID=4639 RepID=A0A426X3P7_ENSVE|nr:hypothetical protein B296_00057294 [Ensete ventricosum]
MLVITYTSEHNHPWPTQRNALAGSTRSHPFKNALNIPGDDVLKSPTAPKEERREATTSNAHLDLEQEQEEGEMDKPTEDDDFNHNMHRSYKPMIPEADQPDDFFADLAELETDPMSLIFSKGYMDGKPDEERGAKASDAMDTCLTEQQPWMDEGFKKEGAVVKWEQSPHQFGILEDGTESCGTEALNSSQVPWINIEDDTERFYYRCDLSKIDPAADRAHLVSIGRQLLRSAASLEESDEKIGLSMCSESYMENEISLLDGWLSKKLWWTGYVSKVSPFLFCFVSTFNWMDKNASFTLRKSRILLPITMS